MNAPILPNRLLPFALHFFRQFLWGCLGLLVFPVFGRAVFASIAYATKRLTDTVLAMHNPAAEASKLLKPFTLFVVLVVARFAMDSAMWFSSYHTRAPMLVRIKEEVFAYRPAPLERLFREHPLGEDCAPGSAPAGPGADAL